VTGGGSGGHITPLLAVAHELKQQQADAHVIYIGQKGDGLADIPAQDANIDEVHLIRAGKLRRYHGAGIRQLFDIPTMFLNLRDIVWVIIGLFQAFQLLRQMRPDVIFVKGGFVGVPVGLSAAVLRIPYVTHDSDALPGLANRLIARWARLHTVALPKEIYSYPADTTLTVGVPLMHHYHPFDTRQVLAAKRQLGLPAQGRVLFVTGGGLGALRINNAVAAISADLLGRYSDLHIVHVAGRNHESALRQRYKKELPAPLAKRVEVKGYITNMHLYSGVADVVVTRAGATSIAEFAAQQKACIVIPNPILTGGHQLKNAQVLAERRAVRLVGEDKLAIDERALMPVLTELFDNPRLIADLGKKLGALDQPNAAHTLAMVLLNRAQP
jgi:UDP-N-acetylglucosamine--N-acetylmuramyl-(pentapeptide) pyrophosphoryl-undecaprenol N-acetylglucosamine transferase